MLLFLFVLFCCFPVERSVFLRRSRRSFIGSKKIRGLGGCLGGEMEMVVVVVVVVVAAAAAAAVVVVAVVVVVVAVVVAAVAGLGFVYLFLLWERSSSNQNLGKYVYLFSKHLKHI